MTKAIRIAWIGVALLATDCSGSSKVDGGSGGTAGAGGLSGAGGSTPSNSGSSGGSTPSSMPGGGPSSGGVAGVAGTPSSTGGATAAGGATASGGATVSGGSGGAGAGGAGVDTGLFPPATDPGKSGSFTPTTVTNTGPSNGYTAVIPKELGQNGVKHPIVIWGNGAVMSPPLYATLLNHIASHGFAILAYNATPDGTQMTAALDWMIAENARQGSDYAGKLDTSKVAAMGHSAGSVATFQIAADPRLTTTMHLNGGTFDPHTELKNLRAPAAFICGDSGGDGLLTGDVARPNCDIDFQQATTPVWYGDVLGASHMTLSTGAATDPMMAKGILAATAGWLRWQLTGDQTMKKLFVGASCDFCTDKAVWSVQQKNL